MAPDAASLLSMSTQAAIAPELVGFATCPSCHTADPTKTNVSVGAGADWHCARCGQRWDAVRLATVAAYTAWLSAQAAASTIAQRPSGSDA